MKKFKTEYEIQGYYYGQWETVTSEETWLQANEQLKCYRDNEQGEKF